MKKNKPSKLLLHRFGKMVENMPGYHNHISFIGIDDFTDDAFAYLMEPVKAVNMLDLNETDISNVSIELLTNLEYVNEIRAKQCIHLNNGCMPHINKLTSLTFLHVRYTNIDIDGLLQLNNLTNLITVMFSADDVESIKQKLLQLKIMLPQCNLVINARPYQFNTIELFIAAIKPIPLTYKLKIKNEPLVDCWSNWLIQPSENYLEAVAQGPYQIDDIEWVVINPIEKRIDGKLTPAKLFNYTEEISKLLDYLSFPYMMDEGIISAYVVNGKL